MFTKLLDMFKKGDRLVAIDGTDQHGREQGFLTTYDGDAPGFSAWLESQGVSRVNHWLEIVED